MATRKKIELRVTLEDIKQGLRLMPGNSYKIIVVRPTVEVSVLEAEDVLFSYDSAAFLPMAVTDEAEEDDDSPFEKTPQEKQKALEQRKVQGLAVLKGFFRYHALCLNKKERKQILITGHTDSAGSGEYNETLSQMRARVVLDLILGDPASRSDFAKNVAQKHSVEDEQCVANWLMGLWGWTEKKYFPLKVDGQKGTKTQTALRELKNHVRKNGFPKDDDPNVPEPAEIEAVTAALKDNDLADAPFWALVFELYQAEIRSSLQEDGLNLAELRSSLLWVDDQLKSVGCGETWPLEARGKDNYKSQTNRRVEILFYDPAEHLGALPCKDGTCDEKDCHIFKNLDVYGSGGKFELKPKLKWKYLSFDDDGYLEGLIQLLVCNYAFEPLRNKSFILKFEGMEEVRSTTTDQGLVIADAPASGTLGRLEVLVDNDQAKESIVWEVESGAVPGAQEPLMNSIPLKHVKGPPTKEVSPELLAALEASQSGDQGQQNDNDKNEMA